MLDQVTEQTLDNTTEEIEAILNLMAGRKWQTVARKEMLLAQVQHSMLLTPQGQAAIVKYIISFM
jgi:hypothetical protein